MLPADILAMPPPIERQATCGSCPKVQSDGYRSDFRCCTFHPKIANFFLGLSLIAEDASAKIVASLCADGFLVPEGLVATPQRWALSLADQHEELYGKSERVLCSFLDRQTGLCSIYRYRNGSCSTFFCLNDDGDAGENFWNSLLNMVAQCELALSQWAMEQVGFDVKGYYARLDILAGTISTVGEARNQAWSLGAREFLWGPRWFGKELDFFRSCGNVIIEQRDRLWEIVSSVNVVESEKFDIAAISVIPPEHHEQISDEDLITGGITSIKDLYDSLISDHRSLIESRMGK